MTTLTPSCGSCQPPGRVAGHGLPSPSGPSSEPRPPPTGSAALALGPGPVGPWAQRSASVRLGCAHPLSTLSCVRWGPLSGAGLRTARHPLAMPPAEAPPPAPAPPSPPGSSTSQGPRPGRPAPDCLQGPLQPATRPGGPQRSSIPPGARLLLGGRGGWMRTTGRWTPGSPAQESAGRVLATTAQPWSHGPEVMRCRLRPRAVRVPRTHVLPSSPIQAPGLASHACPAPRLRSLPRCRRLLGRSPRCPSTSLARRTDGAQGGSLPRQSASPRSKGQAWPQPLQTLLDHTGPKPQAAPPLPSRVLNCFFSNRKRLLNFIKCVSLGLPR